MVFKKSKKNKKPEKFRNQKQLLGAHKILWASINFLKTHRKFLGKVTLAALVVNLLISYLTTSDTTAIYQGLWFTFVSAAMIWSIRHVGDKRSKRVGVAEVYWDGTASALKLLIVLSLMAVVSIPFSIGAFLFGTINYLSIDSLIADVIAGTIWLSLGLISLWLLSRLSPAPIVATLPGINPGKAIKVSWNLTRGQTLEIAKRLLILFIYLFLSLSVVMLLFSSLGLGPNWLKLILGILSFGLIMPFIYVYLFLTYKQLT